jgi:RNA polymerase sigma factor (sigma-70 family)
MNRRTGESRTAACCDEALVRRAQAGDVAAFALLVERHEGALTSFCRRLMAQPAEAHDLAQETLLRALQSIGRLDDPARFGAWLLAIAANLARWWWRERSRRPLSLDQLPATGCVSVPAPHDVLEAAERAHHLITAIGALPAPLRRVLVQHYVEGHSYAEIAASLAVPISTVKGRLFKSRSRLRAAVQPPESNAPRSPGTGRPDRRARTRRGTAGIPLGRRAGVAGTAGTAGITSTTGTGGAPPMEDVTRTLPPLRGVPARAATVVAQRHAALATWHAERAQHEAFDASAVDVLTAAEAEAQGMNHNYIGTEHLLLGLLAEAATTGAAVSVGSTGLSERGESTAGAPGGAGEILVSLGIAADRVRDTIAHMIGCGDRPPADAPGFAPRCKLVIEYAVDEARQLGQERVGAAHLLLGLLREGRGIAALVLESLGTDLPALYEQVRAAAERQPSVLRTLDRSATLRWAFSLLPVDRVAALRRLSAPVASALLAAGAPRVFAAGEVLVAPGAPAAEMHLLLRGRIAVRAGDRADAGATTATTPTPRILSAPQMGVLPLGAANVLQDNTVPSATVTAIDVCEAVTVTRDAFQQLAGRYPWVTPLLRRVVDRQSMPGDDWLP